MSCSWLEYYQKYSKMPKIKARLPNGIQVPEGQPEVRRIQKP
jgi:hypothetical protein